MATSEVDVSTGKVGFIERHELLGMSRDQLLEGLPALRGMASPARITSSRERGFRFPRAELLGGDLL